MWPAKAFETHGMMRRRRTYKKASTPRIVGSVKQFGPNVIKDGSIVNRNEASRQETKRLSKRTKEMRTNIHLTNHGLHSRSLDDTCHPNRTLVGIDCGNSRSCLSLVQGHLPTVNHRFYFVVSVLRATRQSKYRKSVVMINATTETTIK